MDLRIAKSVCGSYTDGNGRRVRHMTEINHFFEGRMKRYGVRNMTDAALVKPR